MTLSRRFLLKTTGLALAGTAAAPSFLRRAAALDNKPKKILVVLFQRGAVDGLNMVVPYFEDRYYKLRPTLAVPRPGSGEDAAIDLDGRFGLHPALEPLAPYWKDNSLAILHAAGSPDSTRSHFDAQDYMESGTPGDKGTRDGWLNRYLGRTETDDPSPLRAVSVGDKLARTLAGDASAVALQRVRDFRLAGGSPRVAQAFEALYGAETRTTVETQIADSGDNTFEALRLLERVRSQRYRPANGARYPRGRFGAKLEQVAQLIKADIGLQVAFADSGGWDTHANQAPQLRVLLDDLAQSLSAFAADLGSRMQDVVVLTMSEFGRTARENGNRGSDHGHATAMMALGGGIQGGQVLGEWPGLAAENLYEQRDLALTTDFRDICSEILLRHLAAPSVEPIFPGRKKTDPLGLFAPSSTVAESATEPRT